MGISKIHRRKQHIGTRMEIFGENTVIMFLIVCKPESFLKLEETLLLWI
jgi:hypothetical protein